MTAARCAYGDTRAGQIHVRIAGPDGGRPLALFHWTPGDGRQYDAVVPHLAAAGYRTFAFDLAGYGRSAPKPADWTVADHARTIGEALAALGVTRLAVVGGHLSAAVACELALEAEVAVTALVLDGPPVWDAGRRDALREGLAAAPPPPAPDEAGSLMPWAWRKALGLARVWDPALALTPERYERIVRLAVATLEADPAGPAILFDYALGPRLAMLSMPVLAVTATTDPLHDVQPDAWAAMPHARRQVFEGSHPLHDPARGADYARPIIAFLGQAAEEGPR